MMTPEEIIKERVEAHRERIQRELAERQAEREAMQARRKAAKECQPPKKRRELTP